ncbi:hypothetical protein DSO57_1009605 [Entomophthora muscae]|uniref:Uncharacterized protein n=1 Tax=Entomophthora muscae TaxID=34485 RepID=A0ACC2SJV9_9FUNG|nr:hypothetical protein DSO57_1009605 [Entomophthora muscae]
MMTPPSWSLAMTQDTLWGLVTRNPTATLILTSLSIDPNYKPTFKQIFDPKTSTIAAFLKVYETVMRRATDELKKEHILTCLHPTCLEVVVPKLPSIVIWEDMKRLLIEEFGGDLSLEVNKDAFMHIAFKPKETLAEFADCFYIEG